MDDRDAMYDLLDDDYEDVRRADQLSHRVKRVAYPPRLMVDFTSLGMEALKRYAQFYNVAVRDEHAKDEVAALVARHFDGALEVEEDDSIVSFIQRIRNGERSATKRSLGDKDRKSASEKKRKKSNSRKRQRDTSTAGSAASSASAGGAGGSGTGGGPGSGAARENGSHSAAEDRKVVAAAVSSSGGSAAAAAPPKSHHKKSEAKKKSKDSGEDNELYCICNLPSYGNMIACDGKKCPNPSQWYHLECVGFSDGRHPDTWLCPECDPKGFAAFQSKKKKSSSKQRSKSPK